MGYFFMVVTCSNNDIALWLPKCRAKQLVSFVGETLPGWTAILYTFVWSVTAIGILLHLLCISPFSIHTITIALFLNLIIVNRLFLVKKKKIGDRQRDNFTCAENGLTTKSWMNFSCLYMFCNLFNFFPTTSNVKEYNIYNSSQTRKKQT